MRKASYAVIVAGATFQGWLLFWAFSMGVIASPSPETDKLISDLLAAKTESAQKELLEHRRGSLTVEVERGLVAEAERLLRQSKNPEALSDYNLAYFVTEQIGDREGTASILRAIGDLESALGRYAEALKSCNSSLRSAKELGDKRLKALALKSIGSIHIWQGQYKEALGYYQESLKLGEEIQNKEVVALALSGIGLVQSWEGDYPESLESYRQSLKLSEELSDKTGIARVLMNIGTVHSALGNYSKALEYYQKSLKLAQEKGEKWLIARMLNNVALVYHLQGNYPQALKLYQDSLKLNEETGDHRTAVITLTNVGHVYFLQKDYKAALEYYRKGLKLGEELGSKADVTLTMRNIGDIYALQGNFNLARRYYKRSLDLQEEIGDKETISSLLISIGKSYQLQGNHERAVEFADRAAALARQIGVAERLSEARTLAGTAYCDLGRFEPAKEAFDEAIDSIENLRSQVAGNEQEDLRYFETKLSPYHGMVDLLINQKDIDQALAYAERAKARALLDLLTLGKVRITRAMSNEERKQEHSLNQEIVTLNRQAYGQDNQPRSNERLLQLAKAQLKYEAFEDSLYTAHSELKARRGRPHPLTLDEAGSLLDRKTAWLEFVVLETKTYLFVLTKEEGIDGEEDKVLLRAYPVGMTPNELFRSVNDLRKDLVTRNWNFEEPARRLYASLIKPAERQLQGRTTLCISPDGILWEVPFQALKRGGNRYLIDDYAIFYAPSLSVLREMARSSPKERAPGSKTNLTSKSSNLETRTLLAFADPVLHHQSPRLLQSSERDKVGGRLADSELEVEGLKRLYGASASRIFIGPAASETQAKSEMENYRILHFATHAFLDSHNPMYSNVLLSPPGDTTGDDGLLEAREVINMNLRADMAVLSACETARGQWRAGEGIIGMSWAFFVAGCPTTVVSQWKVNSHSTAKLMVDFHRNLVLQGSTASKALALRTAALKLRQSSLYEHPFYWAPFIVVGRNNL